MTEQQRRNAEGIWEARINRSRAIAQNSKPVELPPAEWVERPILFIGGTPANAQPVAVPIEFVADRCQSEICEARGACCPGCPAMA